jgi:hypothetical protein
MSRRPIVLVRIFSKDSSLLSKEDIWKLSLHTYISGVWLSVGATALGEPWPLYNQSPPGVRFLNKIIFYRMGLLAPYLTPILEDQGVSLSLDSTL